MARPMDVFMGFVYAPAALCFQSGLNPDVEELLRYNLEAKRRGCKHEEQRTFSDEHHHHWRRCVECGEESIPGLGGLPEPKVLDGVKYEPHVTARYR